MRSIWTIILVSSVASGCGEREGSITESAGAKVGETLTDFASGVGKGVDERMAVSVELSAECAGAGLSKTVAKSLAPNGDGIAVYFIAEKPFSGQMVAKAFNANDQEIGRSKTDVEFEADNAQYVTFSFGSEMDSQLVTTYRIDIRTQTANDVRANHAAGTTATEDD